MKLVMLNGPVCAGKTTVVRSLMSVCDRYFHLSHDSLKWQFSQYSSGKYYEDILTVRLAILETLCDLKYNVITESSHDEARQKHIGIAGQYGYEVIEVNLEADYNLLLRRCVERNAADTKRATSKERFDEVFSLYEKEKNPKATTFRTDRLSIDEVTDKLLKLM